MNIQIALDISINNIFKTYALKVYIVWFSLHPHTMFCICWPCHHDQFSYGWMNVWGGGGMGTLIIDWAIT